VSFKDHFSKQAAEVRRVLKNNGVFAASAYNLLNVEPAIDLVVNRYY
jgi:hypothetical protein